MQPTPQHVPLKIALIGYGKMGKMIEKAAVERGHTITARIDSQGLNGHTRSLEAADVCIDFSHPDAVLPTIEKLASLGKQVVIGTTGWTNHLPKIRELTEKNGIGIIHAPNFSLGVYLFLQMAAHAASLIDPFFEYDIAGFECHHNQKADSPSGTAKAMGQLLLDKLNRKQSLVYELGDRVREPHELHIASMRVGSVPGTHSVIFDSPADTITLTHQARNREGFAWGAIKAAEWIQGRQGLFTLGDMMREAKPGGLV